ncbi:gene transfer agent family protein [Microbaculum marinum]|uniref:Gene transfer agent family protein n=2 Tax=Microbaculum marinum TaxID=1764581 RepID=A0AAW9RLM3_9HYPH
MPNRIRGEVSATLGGRSYTLCLTLGALAELESALAAGDLMALAERFEAGRLSAREALAVIGAGLRGAGHEISDAEAAAMPIDGGAAGYVRLVVELLEATFGAAGGSDPGETGRGGVATPENPTRAGPSREPPGASRGPS